MSHIVEIQTQVRDAEAVRAACQRLHLPAFVERTVKLFSGEATGLAIELPGWRYLVVAQCETGQLAYEDFEGRWGEQRDSADFCRVTRRKKCESRQGSGVTRSPSSRWPTGRSS